MKGWLPLTTLRSWSERKSTVSHLIDSAIQVPVPRFLSHILQVREHVWGITSTPSHHKPGASLTVCLQQIPKSWAEWGSRNHIRCFAMHTTVCLSLACLSQAICPSISRPPHVKGPKREMQVMKFFVVYTLSALNNVYFKSPLSDVYGPLVFNLLKCSPLH